MGTATEDSLQFVPSNVEGLPTVTEVAIFRTAGTAVPRQVGGPPLPRNRSMVSVGWFSARWPISAAEFTAGHQVDRDWFHPPAGRFFRF